MSTENSKEMSSNIQYFQHNMNVAITEKSYKYVRDYKKKLLLNMSNLLEDNKIKYVISHGNLIEYERGTPIHHDDDLDIRMDIEDLDKWVKFCNENDPIDKYNLKFDGRFASPQDFQKNGIQCRLAKFEDFEFEMDIHCDLVPSITNAEPYIRDDGRFDKFWTDYDIDYSNLRKIKFMGVDTFAPNIEDSKRLLLRQYGEKYLIPWRKPPQGSSSW